MIKYSSLLLVLFLSITYIKCGKKDGWKHSDTCMTASGAYYGLICAASGPLAPIMCTAAGVGMGIQSAVCRQVDGRRRKRSTIENKSITNLKLNANSDDKYNLCFLNNQIKNLINIFKLRMEKCQTKYYSKDLDQNLCVTDSLINLYKTRKIFADISKASKEICDIELTGKQKCLGDYGFMTCLKGNKFNFFCCCFSNLFCS